MRGPRYMPRYSGVGHGLLLLALATLCADAASPKRVLILDPYGNQVAPFSAALSAFRTTLAGEFGARLEFYEMSLDRARFQEPEAEGPFLTFLESRITNRSMDLVATTGGPGMDFVVRHHERLFPDTPIVLLAGTPEETQSGPLAGRAGQVTVTLNLAGMVEDILKLQPQTTHIEVVFGASALETATVNQCRREFQRFTNRVTFTWLNDRPLDQIQEHCARLPPHSFILHGLFLVDAAGIPFEQNEPLRRLHAAANAPIYAIFASELGLGAVGGRLFPDGEIGVQAARVAIPLLRGERPDTSLPQLLPEAKPIYDWRELQRWNISESRLPAGSEIRFREPGFWELYRRLIAGTIAIGLLQAGLIISLLVSRARRRHGEEKIHQLSLAVEQSPVLVLITDLQGRMIYVNRKFTETTGYSIGECLGQNPRILKSGECLPATYRELWSRITSGGIWQGEFHNRKKNGELYWERAVISPLLDAAGRITHFVGVKEDITERKRVAEALAASEARLAAGTDLAGLGYYEVDYGARTCFLDDRFGEICGIPAELAQSFQAVEFWLNHVQADDFRRLAQERQKLHGGLVDWISLEYRYHHPTRGPRWLQHSARFAGRSAVATGIRTFGVIRDITERKRAEAEMDGLRLQLWHADRVAQTGAITASLAHELNQPLTGILSTAQAGLRFLAGGKANPELIHELLTNIVHDTKRAGAVINGLRALLHRKETQREPIHLAAAIREILDLLHSELVDRQTDLRLKLESDATVLADKAQIQQVVLNLAMNALEAMPDQPGTERRLVIALTQSSDGDAVVALEDSGPGIPEDRQAKLFDAFWTTKQHGMGIGLAISRSIIESHGGRLWFANNADRGATFYFSLPLSKTDGGPVSSSDP